LLFIAGPGWTSRFSWVALGGVWALSFLAHVTVCTRSSPSHVVCGRHPITLLVTAVIFAGVCTVGITVIVGMTTAVLSQYRHRHIAFTSKVTISLHFTSLHLTSFQFTAVHTLFVSACISDVCVLLEWHWKAGVTSCLAAGVLRKSL